MKVNIPAKPDLLRRLERSLAFFRTRSKRKPDFYDKWGFPYWLWVNEDDENEGGWSSWILSSHQKLPVGRVELLWDDDEDIELCDIVLDDDIHGRGVGAILLQRIFEFAKEKGMRRIHGRVVSDDVARTPHLLDWYQKHGFEVTLVQNGQNGEVAKITRNL